MKKTLFENIFALLVPCSRCGRNTFLSTQGFLYINSQSPVQGLQKEIIFI